jgi:hypothetical protein
MQRHEGLSRVIGPTFDVASFMKPYLKTCPNVLSFLAPEGNAVRDFREGEGPRG